LKSIEQMDSINEDFVHLIKINMEDNNSDDN